MDENPNPNASFRLKDDSLLSEAKEGSTIGEWFKDIKARGSVQNVTQKTSNLRASGPVKARLLIAVQ